MMNTKKEFDLFRKELKESVKELEEKYGLDINVGSIKYSSSGFTANLEVAYGSVEDKEEADFKAYCSMYGLEPSDFGRNFTAANGKTYTISGIRTTRRKYPILVCSNGKYSLMTVETVVNALK